MTESKREISGGTVPSPQEPEPAHSEAKSPVLLEININHKYRAGEMGVLEFRVKNQSLRAIPSLDLVVHCPCEESRKKLATLKNIPPGSDKKPPCFRFEPARGGEALLDIEVTFEDENRLPRVYRGETSVIIAAKDEGKGSSTSFNINIHDIQKFMGNDLSGLLTISGKEINEDRLTEWMKDWAPFWMRVDLALDEDESEPRLVVPPGMVLIPEGWFRMGSADEDQDAETDEKPRHRVWVDEFFIDEGPITNRQYADFLKATGCREPKYWRDSRFNSPDQPVVGVNWDDAVAYAKWAGKRLPTEAEWEKVARGGLEGTTYPWGNEDPRGRACFGLNAEKGRPDPVKRYAPNAYGVYDVAGLAAEWIADWYEGGYYERSPDRNPQGPVSGEHRVVRGGAWNFPQSTLRSARRDALVPSSCYGSLGFRCAKNPR